MPEGAGDLALGRPPVILSKCPSRQTALARCESLKDGRPWTSSPVAGGPTFNCRGDCCPGPTARGRKVTEPSGLPLHPGTKQAGFRRVPQVRQPGSAEPPVPCCPPGSCKGEEKDRWPPSRPRDSSGQAQQCPERLAELQQGAHLSPMRFPDGQVSVCDCSRLLRPGDGHSARSQRAACAAEWPWRCGELASVGSLPGVLASALSRLPLLAASVSSVRVSPALLAPQAVPSRGVFRARRRGGHGYRLASRLQGSVPRTRALQGP